MSIFHWRNRGDSNSTLSKKACKWEQWLDLHRLACKLCSAVLFCECEDGTSVLASRSQLEHHTGCTTKGQQGQERFQGLTRLGQQTDVHISLSLEIGCSVGEKGVARRVSNLG